MKISREIRRAMEDHALREKPLEACGLLGGRDGAATSFYPCVNRARSPVFFTIDPGEILRVMREMDGKGEELLAIFHSHPATRAWPSASDILHFHYPGILYLILSLRDETPRLGAFRIAGGEVEECALEVAERDVGD